MNQNAQCRPDASSMSFWAKHANLMYRVVCTRDHRLKTCPSPHDPGTIQVVDEWTN